MSKRDFMTLERLFGIGPTGYAGTLIEYLDELVDAMVAHGRNDFFLEMSDAIIANGERNESFERFLLYQIRENKAHHLYHHTRYVRDIIGAPWKELEEALLLDNQTSIEVGSKMGYWLDMYDDNPEGWPEFGEYLKKNHSDREYIIYKMKVQGVRGD
jgi:hypothetical protein